MRVMLIVARHSDARFGPDRGGGGTVHGLPRGQPQASWAKGIAALGHELRVVTYSPPTGSAKEQGALRRWLAGALRRAKDLVVSTDLRRKIEEAVDEFSPKVVIISGLQRLIPVDTIEALRARKGFTLIFTHGLSPSWMATETDVALARLADAVFLCNETSARDWREHGVEAQIEIPISGCDPELVEGVTRSMDEALCDVGFVGTLHGDLYRRRVELLRSLEGFDLGIWTPSSERFLREQGLERYFQGRVSRRECPEVYASCKIMVNIHGVHAGDGGNLSTFEIPAAGGFQLVDAVHEDWFELGEEIEAFESTEILREKITYYLANSAERERLAQQGRKRALRDHNYKARFRELLGRLDVRTR